MVSCNHAGYRVGNNKLVEIAATRLPDQVPNPKIYILENNLKSTTSTRIPGLFYHPMFISVDEQNRILDIVYGNNWSLVLHRRQQFYGQVYFHTTHDLKTIQPMSNIPADDAVNELLHDINAFDWLIDRLMDLKLFNERPTQVLVNEYVGPMGIASHVDVETAFGDTIVTLSLLNSCWLSLTRLNSESCSSPRPVKVLMEPMSLLVMKGDSRTIYKHGITKSKWVCLCDGQGVARDCDWVRISLTFRVLLDTRKQVSIDRGGW